MLRLARLPDRTPIKVTLALETYGETARIEDLAPLMLRKFLDSDRHFRRARKSNPKTTKGD
jgi:hypothetical protein